MQRDRLVLISPGRVLDGRLILPRKGERFRELLKTLPNCNATVRVEMVDDPISDQLRAFYWSVVVGRFAEVTGYEEREAHQLLKETYTPITMATVRGQGKLSPDGLRVLESSLMAFNNREAWDYIERIQRGLAQMGEPIFVPDPNQGQVVTA